VGVGQRVVAMVDEQVCVEALCEAAKRLGKSPTKAEYEELGLQPAASTILRQCGGWNAAKERAGLTTNPSRGSRVQPKPEDVELPDGLEWAALTQDQRWHHKNRDRDRPYTEDRKRRHRAWVTKQKAQRGCADCGLSDGVCLDFHHREDERKWLTVSQMVTYGYRKSRLAEEIAKCEVLCANCHRRHHADDPEEIDWTATDAVAPATVGDSLVESNLPDQYEPRRAWVGVYKQVRGCSVCDVSDVPCLSFHHPPEWLCSFDTLCCISRISDAPSKVVDGGFEDDFTEFKPPASRTHGTAERALDA
jgi:hypothetical protein